MQRMPSKLQKQMDALFGYPCVMEWSNGEITEAPASVIFNDEACMLRYKGYLDNGKPYPVNVTVKVPEDLQSKSRVFDGCTVEEDCKLLSYMVKDMWDSFKRGMGLSGSDPGNNTEGEANQ